ncbi:TPA: hypothetical protein EYN98_18640 [Candidatus Poribacteria bacterium]|nr:hypothetical protein [Candidatus Poribacteria bacterium]HIB89603.1 hypothetical protein [Candidatus Poribacteria bacterium]HIC00921.1 hypothetical protein [Candidatus Poribacteria bacterium]HIC18150.1 hypothetical protein [Candidatus Poribacteria bacterium]HIN29397.1 hypothetical protein [Candidatus Poribacteria bacterium]
MRPELRRRVCKHRRQTAGRKLNKKVCRYVVERSFSWYQRKCRRLATRWERQSKIFSGLVLLGFSLIWIDRLLLG